jgi:DNA-binding IclR family transcriptional regulator
MPDLPSSDLEALILDALRAEPLGMSELAARLRCPAERLRPALSELRESGRITMIGQKRGARYALAAGIGV